MDPTRTLFYQYTGMALSLLAAWITLRCARTVIAAGRGDTARLSVRKRDGVTLLLVTLFQLLTLLQLLVSGPEHAAGMLLGFAVLTAGEWGCFLLERGRDLPGFFPELIAFFLTGVGFAVAGTSTPDGMVKQSLLYLSALSMFAIMLLYLRHSRLAVRLPLPAGLAAAAVLAVTLVLGDTVFGAKSWIRVSNSTFQPSEMVKILYLYAGTAAMDKLSRRSVLIFTGFSAVCVGLLALMGDFGTALVFFVAYLVIAYMRSGNPLTLIVPTAAAAAAVALVLAARPYVAQRFSSWGHVWEDPLGKGYQQVRAMSALAAGGCFGRGAGTGWLKDVYAANTDLVFALVSEELGLIPAVCCVLLLILLAAYAVFSAGRVYSGAYYAAGCGAVTMYLAQTALNVFGSLDLLPFTGVTFPFVSRGGSSLLGCWGMLAFLRAGERLHLTAVGTGKKAPAKPADKSNGKKSAAGTAAGKTASAKKPTAKKPAATKPTAKKPAGKTAPAKKPAPKKTGGRGDRA